MADLLKPLNSLGKIGVSGQAEKARALGYMDDVFYRGEANGVLPAEYPTGKFFSRSKEYADGFAGRGGATSAREFKLKPDDLFVDANPMDASQLNRIVQASRSSNPKLADDLVDMIAPGKNSDWFAAFAKRNPTTTVADNSAGIRQILTVHASDDAILRQAGFRGIDSGRDVQMLTGDGIRLATAKFDPANANSRNITAGIAAGGLGAGAMMAGDADAKTNGNTQMSTEMMGAAAGGQAAMAPGPGGDFMALLQELEQAIAVDAAQGQGNAQQGQLGPNAQRSLAEIALRREPQPQSASMPQMDPSQAPVMPNPLSNFDQAGQWQPPADVMAAAGPRTETLGADLMSGAGTFAANASDPLGVPSYLTGMVAPGVRDAWRGAQEGAPEVKFAGQMMAPLSMIGKGFNAAGSMMKAAPVPTAAAIGGATALSSDPAQSGGPVAQTPASGASSPTGEKPIADRVVETLGGAAREAGNAIKGAVTGSDKFTAMPLEEYRRQNLGNPKTIEDFKAAETERLNKDPAYTKAIEDGMNKRAANMRSEADAKAAKAFKEYNPKTEEGRVDQRYKDYVADLEGRKKVENDKPFKDRNPSLAALATYGPAAIGGLAGFRAAGQFNAKGRALEERLASPGLSAADEATTRLAMQKLQQDGMGLTPLALGTAAGSVETRGMMDAADKFLMPDGSGANKKVTEKYTLDSLPKLGDLAKEYGLNAAAGPLMVKSGTVLQKAIGRGGPDTAAALAPLDDAATQAARTAVANARAPLSAAGATPKPKVHPKHPNRAVNGQFISPGP